MFNPNLIQPDPQWNVPVSLLSDDKLLDLFLETCEDSEEDANYRQQAVRFAQKWPEFGRDWKWYFTEYLDRQYGN